MEKENNVQPESVRKTFFIKEVAKYFMNFLETDFKKRRIPKRNTIQRSKNGLKVGIDLEKYPKLKRTIIALVNRGFEKETLQIKKGEYTGNIPKTLFNLILNKIKDLSKKSLNNVFAEICELAKEQTALNAKEYDKFLEETREETKNILAKHFILPFLDDLDKPLENLELADENSKYQLEIDVVDAVFSLFEEKYTEVLQAFFQETQKAKDFDLKRSLQGIIALGEIKDSLTQFFENMTISDAFSDIYQLYRNNRLIDKTEIYLYFYEVSLGNEKFPVLYTPVSILKEEGRFVFQFERKVFVNTRAIDFVVQEFNFQVQNKATLRGEFDRILYLSKEEDFFPVIENVIRKIENFFEFNRNIDLQDSKLQKGMNLVSSLSNKCYLYLFDKSDEALINDYEEILNDDGEISENFSNLLNGFIQDNPKAYMEEIDDAWHEKSPSQRLVFESPVPLNDEQKQVLMALRKEDCKFMILEGPPGTGKSHTITAIICRALLEEKSVLVLSDKKEALDVVEDKISATLNKIRHKDDFQNPILRLGRTGSKFYKIVQGQTIQQIRDHYYAYKHRKDEYDDIRSEVRKDLTQNIKDNITYFEGINLQDVDYYFKQIDKFTDIDWINDEDVNRAKVDFLKIKRIIQHLKKQKNCSFRAAFATKENLKYLQTIRDSLEKLEETKKVFWGIKPAEGNVKELENISWEGREAIARSLKRIKEAFQTLATLLPQTKLSFHESITDRITDQMRLSEIKETEKLLNKTGEIYNEAKLFFARYLKDAGILQNFVIPNEISVQTAMKAFKAYLSDLKRLRNPIFGYFLKKECLYELTRVIKRKFHFFNIEEPAKYKRVCLAIYDLFEFISSKLVDIKEKEKIFRGVIEVFILVSGRDGNTIYEGRKKSIGVLSEEVSELHNVSDIRINDIEKCLLYLEIINLVRNIGKDCSRVSNIKLDVNVSLKDLESNAARKGLERTKKLISALEELLSVGEDIHFIEGFQKNNKQLSERLFLHIDSENLNSLHCQLLDYSNEDILAYLQFKGIEQKLESQFNNPPKDNFFDSINSIEELSAAQMTYFLDKRIIEYTQGYATEVNTLKSIIRKKKKFPKDLFRNLKKAFPCILAGIRDYAEYIPLEKDLFDLIIIDEASQVSIAQALPALIRGKQIIVLGDDKQFSNVKAGNASKVTNQQYKSKVQTVFFEEWVKGEDRLGWGTKVKDNFDIKNSILKFLRFIRNYECQLKKHFRCYPEIISYSDKHFYDNTLQCMKIRGKKIDDVIKIDVIEHDGKLDVTKNTNELEIAFIIKKLKDFHKKGIIQSIGIITPHREQVTLLFDKINEMEQKDWLFEKCKLKIMTFDTCQGEERDYVFYSMVATREKDRLNWIFLKSFSSISEEVEGTIKSQRMNVGFSRAKECIHFILSKPIEEFQGEIRNALLHYKNELRIGKERIHKKLESEMEYKVEDIFYKTKFYKDNKDNIEFIPQFQIGDYLRQLDKNYTHPAYRTDFLLMFEDSKIVIEYDGFKDHFTDREEVNKSNYRYYMKAEDVYREKILEGYGYKFLRINRFNIGKDPVATLNERLGSTVKKKSKIR